jgi:hypothetical protein
LILSLNHEQQHFIKMGKWNTILLS